MCFRINDTYYDVLPIYEWSHFGYKFTPKNFTAQVVNEEKFAHVRRHEYDLKSYTRSKHRIYIEERM